MWRCYESNYLFHDKDSYKNRMIFFKWSLLSTIDFCPNWLYSRKLSGPTIRSMYSYAIQPYLSNCDLLSIEGLETWIYDGFLIAFGEISYYGSLMKIIPYF